MLTTGQLLADRYRLARRIAVGGMGEVWEATDSRLDRAVAVKVLKPELSGDPEFLHRFRTEARTTASLNHPGIAAVHDYGETASLPDGPEDTAYLVMELVAGEPLAAILAGQGRLAPDRTLDLLQQCGAALQAAHERGYVHRDVKPGNILVGPTGKVKLTDFGIAKAADAAPVTRSGMVMGTAHYIAPEQAVGQEAEPASDVYSLAVVGYECLIGHRPFLSENAVTVAMMHIRDLPPPLPPDVPPGVRALIDTTLVKDPRHRYRSGGEFAAAVAAVRTGQPLPTPSGLAMALQQVPGMPGGMPGFPPSGPMIPMQGGGPAMSHPMLAHPMAQGGGTMPPSQPVPPPPGLRRPRSVHPLWLLVAVLVVLLVALGVWVLTQSVRGSSGAAHPAENRSSTPTQVKGAPSEGVPNGLAQLGPISTVPVRAGDYVGLAADRTERQLGSLGLRTALRTTPAGQADPAHCVVTGVTPSGDVAIGNVVTIDCTADGTTR